MENGFMLQLLVTAGVIGYGIWSAVQKSAKQKIEQQNRDEGGDVNSPEKEMTWEDYFPSSMDMSTRSESIGNNVIEDRKPKGMRSHTKIDNEGEGGYHFATSSFDVTNGSTEHMDEDSVYDMREVAKIEVVTDLRTIIISNELLKPKYMEY